MGGKDLSMSAIEILLKVVFCTQEIGIDDGLGTSALLEESDSSGSAVGLIVGSAIGVGLLALTVIFLCILLIVRKSRQQKMQQVQYVADLEKLSLGQVTFWFDKRTHKEAWPRRIRAVQRQINQRLVIY